MDYINRLDNYDGNQLASIALEPQHALYQEALCIYKKFHEHVSAIKVMIYNLDNIRQATEFAEKTNKPEVWSELGQAQIGKGDQNAAIEAFIKAQDPSEFENVMALNPTGYEPEMIINFCLMARSKKKD